MEALLLLEMAGLPARYSTGRKDNKARDEPSQRKTSKNLLLGNVIYAGDSWSHRYARVRTNQHRWLPNIHGSPECSSSTANSMPLGWFSILFRFVTWRTSVPFRSFICFSSSLPQDPELNRGDQSAIEQT
jgi:hypothetical protein